jgi:molybdopterin/thiamine biosynthesis adenylyltransferase
VPRNRVLVVGAGGLGSPVIRVLRDSGAKDITLVDPDRVALDNLHRQILFGDEDIGRGKADVLAERLGIEALAVRLDDANGRDLIAGRAVVVDGTDSFASKYRINDLCLELGVPLVHAGAAQFRGQVLLVRRGGPCLRCLLPQPPDAETDECRLTGVFGPAAGVVAALAAAAALRVLNGDRWRLRDGGRHRSRPRRRLPCGSLLRQRNARLAARARHELGPYGHVSFGDAGNSPAGPTRGLDHPSIIIPWTVRARSFGAARFEAYLRQP